LGLFSASPNNIPKFLQVLWEVFASNITHCEVETREELQEVSTASHQSSNQRIWGSDTGHWIAIQELGKLAMVSNTLDKGKHFFCDVSPFERLLFAMLFRTSVYFFQNPS